MNYEDESLCALKLEWFTHEQNGALYRIVNFVLTLLHRNINTSQQNGNENFMCSLLYVCVTLRTVIILCTVGKCVACVWPPCTCMIECACEESLSNLAQIKQQLDCTCHHMQAYMHIHTPKLYRQLPYM